MIHYLNSNYIDRQKWDHCISSSSNGRIYALSWYLDAVCKNWEALVEDDYKAVMPLTARKKYRIYYLFQPHFTQQLGIFSQKEISSLGIVRFLKAIPEKFRLVEICVNTENSEQIEQSADRQPGGFSLKKNSNYELSLNKEYRSIYNAYAENTKRNIKKAIRNGIVITDQNVTVNELIALFRKNKGAGIRGLKNDFYDTLILLTGIAAKKKRLKILGAFSDKKLCAGAVFLYEKKTAVFLFSATSEEAKQKGAMFLLVDKFVSEHAETLAILDFEGSNDPGLARFYKSFGAKEYVYLQLKKNNLPKYVQWLKK